MHQIIICRDCPYFKAKDKQFNLYCKMTKKRCIELGQYEAYKKCFEELMNKITDKKGR